MSLTANVSVPWGIDGNASRIIKIFSREERGIEQSRGGLVHLGDEHFRAVHAVALNRFGSRREAAYGDRSGFADNVGVALLVQRNPITAIRHVATKEGRIDELGTAFVDLGHKGITIAAIAGEKGARGGGEASGGVSGSGHKGVSVSTDGNPSGTLGSVAPQEGGIDQRRARRIELGDEGIAVPTPIVGLKRIRSHRKIRLPGLACDVGTAGGVESDCFNVVFTTAAQAGRVKQSTTFLVEFCHEAIGTAVVVQHPGSGRETGGPLDRLRLADHKRAARGVDGDAIPSILITAAKQGGIDQSIPGRIELHYKGIAAGTLITSTMLFLEGLDRCREVAGTGAARNIGIPIDVDGNAVAAVIPVTPEVGGIDRRIAVWGDFDNENIPIPAIVGRLIGARRHREIHCGFSAACHIDIACGIHGKGLAGLFFASSQIGRVDQDGVNHQRLTGIIALHGNPGFFFACQDVFGVQFPALPIHLLVNDRTALEDFHIANRHEEIAIAVGADLPRSAECQLHLLQIGSGRKHDIIFQMPLVAVENEVNTWIYLLIDYFLESRNMGDPLMGILPQKEIRFAWQLFDPLHFHRGIRPGQFQMKRG